VRSTPPPGLVRRNLKWFASESAAAAARPPGNEGQPFYGAMDPDDEGRALQAALLRDIVGNPFRSITFDHSWRKPAVVDLAREIHEQRAFERMPSLADALEDAGCDNADVLQHCLQPGEHVRGCWVVDLILEME